MADEEKQMGVPPKLREWNLNTVILGVSLAAMAVGWGMTWAGTRADIDRNSELIAELRTQMAEINSTNQRFANLDYRLSVEETATSSINETLRSLERSITEVSTDVRVLRSYLERSDSAVPPAD